MGLPLSYRQAGRRKCSRRQSHTVALHSQAAHSGTTYVHMHMSHNAVTCNIHEHTASCVAYSHALGRARSAAVLKQWYRCARMPVPCQAGTVPRHCLDIKSACVTCGVHQQARASRRDSGRGCLQPCPCIPVSEVPPDARVVGVHNTVKGHGRRRGTYRQPVQCTSSLCLDRHMWTDASKA
jgi:hypothetical protein